MQPSSNLSIQQQHHHLNLLRNHPDFINLDSNKNVGPCIIERDVYIQNMLEEHLNTKSYQQISNNEATKTLVKLHKEITSILFEHEFCLSNREKIHFERGLKLKHQISQFYGTARVHHAEAPIVGATKTEGILVVSPAQCSLWTLGVRPCLTCT